MRVDGFGGKPWEGKMSACFRVSNGAGGGMGGGIVVGEHKEGGKGAVRRSRGERPWAFGCEKSFKGKTPGILYLFVSEIFICHAGRFIMGLSVCSAH